MNLSVVPPHNPPISRDFSFCNSFYQQGPEFGQTQATLHDCLVAFSILDSGLPPGDTIVQWQNHLQPGQEWVLPYTWTYGTSAVSCNFFNVP